MRKITAFLSLLLLITFFVNGSVFAEDVPSEEAKSDEEVHFVELNPLILPVVGKRGAVQMVSLIISVEVDSSEKVDEVKKYAPRLTDAFLSDLYVSFGSMAEQNGGMVPIPILKKRLNALSDKVLGHDVVNDVLLQVMQKRRT